MKQRIFVSLTLLLATVAFAQQQARPPRILSPEIRADGTVTFRVSAPRAGFVTRASGQKSETPQLVCGPRLVSARSSTPPVLGYLALSR